MIRSVFLITTVDTSDIFGLTGLQLFCYVLSLHIITQTLSISSWYWISCVLFGSLNIVQYCCLAASDFSCLCNLSMYVCWWFPLLSSSILLPLQLMLFFKIDLQIFVCWINCQIFYLKYLSFCSGLSCFCTWKLLLVKYTSHFLSLPRVCLFGVVALVISWVSLGLEFAVSAVSFCITAWSCWENSFCGQPVAAEQSFISFN